MRREEDAPIEQEPPTNDPDLDNFKEFKSWLYRVKSKNRGFRWEAPKFVIHIRTVIEDDRRNKFRIALPIPPGITIKNVKELIQALEGFPVNQQLLAIRREVLEDHRLVEEYEFGEADEVYLLVKASRGD